MKRDVIWQRIVQIIESYSSLSILPFTIKVESLVYVSSKIEEFDGQLYFNILQALMTETDEYIRICKNDNNYLLSFDLYDEEVMFIVNTKFKEGV